jgi:hypothetical protein
MIVAVELSEKRSEGKIEIVRKDNSMRRMRPKRPPRWGATADDAADRLRQRRQQIAGGYTSS